MSFQNHEYSNKQFLEEASHRRNAVNGRGSVSKNYSSWVHPSSQPIHIQNQNYRYQNSVNGFGHDAIHQSNHYVADSSWKNQSFQVQHVPPQYEQIGVFPNNYEYDHVRHVRNDQRSEHVYPLYQSNQTVSFNREWNDSKFNTYQNHVQHPLPHEMPSSTSNQYFHQRGVGESSSWPTYTLKMEYNNASDVGNSVQYQSHNAPRSISAHTSTLPPQNLRDINLNSHYHAQDNFGNKNFQQIPYVSSPKLSDQSYVDVLFSSKSDLSIKGNDNWDKNLVNQDEVSKIRKKDSRVATAMSELSKLSEDWYGENLSSTQANSVHTKKIKRRKVLRANDTLEGKVKTSAVNQQQRQYIERQNNSVDSKKQNAREEIKGHDTGTQGKHDYSKRFCSNVGDDYKVHQNNIQQNKVNIPAEAPSFVDHARYVDNELSNESFSTSSNQSHLGNKPNTLGKQKINYQIVSTSNEPNQKGSNVYNLDMEISDDDEIITKTNIKNKEAINLSKSTPLKTIEGNSVSLNAIHESLFIDDSSTGDAEICGILEVETDSIKEDEANNSSKPVPLKIIEGGSGSSNTIDESLFSDDSSLSNGEICKNLEVEVESKSLSSILVNDKCLNHEESDSKMNMNLSRLRTIEVASCPSNHKNESLFSDDSSLSNVDTCEKLKMEEESNSTKKSLPIASDSGFTEKAVIDKTALLKKKQELEKALRKYTLEKARAKLLVAVRKHEEALGKSRGDDVKKIEISNCKYKERSLILPAKFQENRKDVLEPKETISAMAKKNLWIRKIRSFDPQTKVSWLPDKPESRNLSSGCYLSNDGQKYDNTKFQEIKHSNTKVQNISQALNKSINASQEHNTNEINVAPSKLKDQLIIKPLDINEALTSEEVERNDRDRSKCSVPVKDPFRYDVLLQKKAKLATFLQKVALKKAKARLIEAKKKRKHTTSDSKILDPKITNILSKAGNVSTSKCDKNSNSSTERNCLPIIDKENKRIIDYVKVKSSIEDKSEIHDSVATSSTQNLSAKSEQQKVINQLKEKQYKLKESISASKKTKDELQSEKEITELKNLVQKQRILLNTHGVKLKENTLSLKKCSKNKSEVTSLLLKTEIKVETLLKKKKILESLSLKQSEILFDLRKRRDAIERNISGGDSIIN
mmetsp:Transcript_22706/g.32036  ORF Transcript_22706/g.32036 Transcript_22706/m.32036 type:complete len:1146 (-) Transcript_22706:393-3830(-)|eukprot:CAMPEP_0184859640 /NCGR_PEP_ID=MMETSP0580-20130426/4623_1 /TAXON_ID=1118495 /ORGANISM="Dactyliosolen fragilissimus" /LENGTH=1145 /DNA_ID=CAMNT_0027356391 /DNA_START=176 /DNA_END=3613 /DNA_ORIENTATION=-